MVVFSFVKSGDLRFPITGLTLLVPGSVHRLERLRGDPQQPRSGVFAALIVTCVVTPAVLFLSRSRVRWAGAVTALIIAPATLPGIVVGVSLLNLFGDLRMTLSLVTVTVGHIIYCIPFFYLILNARLRHFDRHLEEAAMDLGAGPFQRFRRVVSPSHRASYPRCDHGGTGPVVGRVPDHLLHDRRPQYAPACDLVRGHGRRRVIDPSVNTVGTIMIVGSLIVVVLTRRLIVETYS